MILAQKPKAPYCQAMRCRSPALKDRKLCSRHKHIWRKQVNPFAYYRDALKCNAKRRGKHFDLSLAELRHWAMTTGYMTTEGKRDAKLTIDRIDCEKGYTIANIQILTLEDNSAKGYQERMQKLLDRDEPEDDNDPFGEPDIFGGPFTGW